MSRWFIALAFVSACLGCAGGSGGTPAFQLESQTWNDVGIVIEARQSPVDPQMFEFLMYTSANRKPAHDLNVSIRVREQDPWKQAIQDGWSGVYRRASRVSDPDTEKLQIQIRRGEQQSELQIPLKDWKKMKS